MNHQEMFDIAARGILSQGGPSAVINDDGEAVCRYRSANGRRCAAGFFLNDETYNVNMEEQGAFFVFKDDEDFNDKDRRFLQSLQSIHDGAAFADPEEGIEIAEDAEFFKTWVPDMVEFAESNDLTVPKELVK